MAQLANPSVLCVNQLLWTGAALCGGTQLLGFIHGYVLQTEALFDTIGGLNFLAMIPLAYFQSQANNDDPRKITMTTLFALSRMWLLLFLCYRVRLRDGDSRFEEIKKSFCKFLITWMMQAFWVFAISMPLLVVLGAQFRTEFRWYDYVFAATFSIGLLLQISSDIIKAKWVANGRPGGICKIGPWAWSRHPNYFGEILMWFSAWAFTWPLVRGFEQSFPGGMFQKWFLVYMIIAGLSPCLTCVLLMCVSGLPTCEGKNLKRYYTNPNLVDDYKEYRQSSFMLVPFPGGKCFPLVLKRIFCCEWPMYDFKEEELDDEEKMLTSTKSKRSSSASQRSRSGGSQNASLTMSQQPGVGAGDSYYVRTANGSVVQRA
ncbi:unnamed protein product [Amoebophrya sp. A120]|nr:unnamed protein product [Amoebophrya sp. A120]|eukprot:GSA120T00010900001.1